MESVEVSARNVEEAIQQALIRLGRSRDEVDITVLSEGHKGLLGFVRGENARVRATLREPSSPTPSEVPEEAAPRPTRSAQGSGAGTRRSTGAPRRSGSAAAKPASSAPAPADTPTKPAPRPPESAVVAQDSMEELLEKMGIDADVYYRGGTGIDDTPILLEVVGDDLGILIGRRGETLSSLQFILNLIVGKRLDSWVRVVVDVEGYRARREEALRAIATRAAERVRRTGQSVPLEPMPANERRIIHLTLQDSPHVTTESTGQGEDRRVNVLPRTGGGGRGSGAGR